MRKLWLDGSFENELMALLEATPDCKALCFERKIRDGLKRMGYEVRRNVIVPDRGDGFRGKVDIVAERDGFKIALELDCETPRRKSIFKVKQVPGATLRMVYCRKDTL